MMIAARPGVRILDCTLRDGSYAIDFRFTASDTEIIVAALDRAGIPLIEVGHGVGLGASRAGKGIAAESDEEYLAAAARGVTRAKFGMFCIPGIATLDDVDRAAAGGAGFLRIGTNVSEAHEAEPFITRAKRHGLEVMANFMKSYAMKPAEFAERVRLAESLGADAVYIVDSAGGMLADELDAYFAAIAEVTSVPIGFHGHNNLGLAVAHSLHAVQRGATIIDGSLKGMGRSAGNAPTEQLIAGLIRMGISVGIDLIEILDIGEECVDPFLVPTSLRPLDVVAGFSLFHSSFMGTILKSASRHRIDPRKLIMAVCAVDTVNAPEELVERIARRIGSEEEQVLSGRYRLHQYFGSEQD